ncbi:MAG: DUF3795 domain-containing protein [Candidatus Zixiibacteriota bacterium]|jgi:hypothetical protein
MAGIGYGAYCGLYCGACWELVATERGEVEKLREDAESAAYTAEQLSCRGCRTDVVAFFCLDCEMRSCAQERGVAFCSDCGDYPCEYVREFQADKYAHHSAVLKNLDTIRERGADAWLVEQEERWKCPSCGARFTWYEDTCGDCGAELYDARAEEGDLE